MNEKSRAEFVDQLGDLLTSRLPSPGEDPNEFVRGRIECLVEVAATTMLLVKTGQMPAALDTFEAALRDRVVTPAMAAMAAAIEAWPRP